MKLKVWVNGVTSTQRFPSPEACAAQVALAHRAGERWDVRHEWQRRPLEPELARRLIDAVSAEL